MYSALLVLKLWFRRSWFIIENFIKFKLNELKTRHDIVMLFLLRIANIQKQELNLRPTYSTYDRDETNTCSHLPTRKRTQMRIPLLQKNGQSFLNVYDQNEKKETNNFYIIVNF